MPFRSILFERPDDLPGPGAAGPGAPAQPQFFTDLNLGQVCSSLISGRAQYDLAPYFLTPLHDEPAIRYRHQVLQDLQRDEVREVVVQFARAMEAMRQRLGQAERLRNPYQRQRWFLDAVDTYSRAVGDFAVSLQQVELHSEGMRSFREYVQTYADSGNYQQLAAEGRDLLDRLAEVRYCVHIRGARVRVTRYEDEDDYGADVQKTFAKFAEGAAKDYRVPFRSLAEMEPVEAQILDCVVKLFPEVFQDLNNFCRRQASYADGIVGTFDREVQFYLAYLDYLRPMERVGLEFCYPEVSVTSKQSNVDHAFDIALASKLATYGKTAVTNGWHLDGPERVIIVTGPNQGGKTTFARMFGQLHYLASLGLPVPGRSARLFVPDRVFTHFDREENLQNLRGKLEDELMRIHEVLQEATSRSVVVMNESFSSTSLEDASFLGAEILRRMTEKDLLCLYVTFIDRLATLNQACVSMVAEIVPDNPAGRTFRIARKPADGLAYAAAIAGKYGLTYQHLTERIAG
jgi:DNA mismatch repair protein MutS